MPIEVRELVIKARVEDLPNNAGNNGEGRPATGSRPALTERELQAIVEMCTEAVLKIMDRQKQR